MLKSVEMLQKFSRNTRYIFFYKEWCRAKVMTFLPAVGRISCSLIVSRFPKHENSVSSYKLLSFNFTKGNNLYVCIYTYCECVTPTLSTSSGETDAVEGVALAIRKVGVRSRQLATSDLDQNFNLSPKDDN